MAGPWGFEPQFSASKAERIIQATLRAHPVPHMRMGEIILLPEQTFFDAQPEGRSTYLEQVYHRMAGTTSGYGNDITDFATFHHVPHGFQVLSQDGSIRIDLDRPEHRMPDRHVV